MCLIVHIVHTIALRVYRWCVLVVWAAQCVGLIGVGEVGYVWWSVCGWGIGSEKTNTIFDLKKHRGPKSRKFL